MARAPLFALLLILGGACTRPPAPSHATLRPEPGTRLERGGSAGDELLILHDGGVMIELQPLAANQRYRVVTSDGEVEARGTEFQVTAAGDHLRAVWVKTGVVEVRPKSLAPTVLHAGETWDSAPPR